MSETLCPQAARMPALLHGTLLQEEMAGLTSHLGGCKECQGRLEALAAGRADWSGPVRQLGRPSAAEPEPALLQVIDLLKDPADFSTAPSSAPAADDGLLLSLLSPGTKEGLLGRLGDYEVTEVIGRGGMGVVLKAFDPSLHRYVAIKVLAPQWATSATARTRFAREAKAAAAVSHEHVVAIHDVDEANGLPYLVMEYVPGLSLQERLDRDGPLDLKAILRIGMQTAAGLAAAHAQGLIHRDIKPANILLENGVDRVKITDFGLARTADDASLTQSGVLAGTPHYMAPEQARGEALDHRADLFSLGSVLYALCTGRPPFRAGTTLAVVRRVSEATPRPVHEINSDIPAWLGELIAQLHSQNPADRFQSATEVAELLAQYLAHLQQPVTVPLPHRRKQRAARAAAATPAAPRRLWLVPAAGLVLFVGGLGLVASRNPLHRLDDLARRLGLTASEATLRVDIDDPRLQVVIDADADTRQVEGLGVHEVRLPAGAHSVCCLLNGELQSDALVTLKRGEVKDLKARRRPLGGLQARFLQQGRDVWSVAFSPDGRTLAVGCGREGRPGKLCLWDPATGTSRAELEAPLDVRSVAFSPDGKLLATGEFDHTVRLRDPLTGAERAVLVGHNGKVNTVAFTRDGATLATGSLDGTVVLWDVTTHHLRRALHAHADWVLTLAFTPNGRLLVTGSKDGTAKLWDARTGAARKILHGHNGPVEFVNVSPDGRTLATASWDGTVKLWDLRDGTELATLAAPTGEVYAVQFAPDGLTLATACADGGVYLWDVAARALRAQLPVHGDSAYALAYSADGRRLATGSFDGTVRVWDLTGPLPPATSRKRGDKRSLLETFLGPKFGTQALSVRLGDKPLLSDACPGLTNPAPAPLNAADTIQRKYEEGSYPPRPAALPGDGVRAPARGLPPAAHR